MWCPAVVRNPRCRLNRTALRNSGNLCVVLSKWLIRKPRRVNPRYPSAFLGNATKPSVRRDLSTPTFFCLHVSTVVYTILPSTKVIIFGTSKSVSKVFCSWFFAGFRDNRNVRGNGLSNETQRIEVAAQGQTAVLLNLRRKHSQKSERHSRSLDREMELEATNESTHRFMQFLHVSDLYLRPWAGHQR